MGALRLVSAVALGACVVPLAGVLSDRCGRVAVYRPFAAFQLLVAFAAWWVLSQGDIVSTVIAISVALGAGVRGARGAAAGVVGRAAPLHRRVRRPRGLRGHAGGIAPLVGAGIIAWMGGLHGGGRARCSPGCR